MSDTNKIDDLLKKLDKTDSFEQAEGSLDMHDPLGKVIEVSSMIKPTGESDLDALWSSFEEKIEGLETTETKEDETIVKADIKRTEGAPKTIFLNKYSVGIAASICLLLVSLFVFYQKNILVGEPHFVLIKEVPKGEQAVVVLPDSSKVWLNASSKLYQQGDWTNVRSLKLEGEGFFEVEKGRKFSVVTEYGVVEVLGTSFNVFAYKEQPYRVLCETGKVKVTVSKEEEKTSIEEVLTPGEELEVKEDEVLKSVVAKKELTTNWKEGVFRFKEASLYSVARELERQFNISIKVDKGIEKKFTGVFTNRDLDIALQTVCIPLGLSYAIDGGIVSIR